MAPAVDEESHSQAFAFSALFQSSQVTSPGISALHTTPRPGSLNLSSQEDSFIGFSWGPPEDAFPELPGDVQIPSALHGTATPRPTRLSVPLTTPNPRLLVHPITPAFHSYPFLTPNRPGVGTTHQTLPRASTVRRTAGRRPVSDREAMKLLADCVGMSARKKVLESGRKPRVLPSFSSQKALRFLPPAVAVQDYASSSQGRMRPAVIIPAASSEDTETESEGPPSPSPTPRPGSAMSMLSRRSGTPTITGTYSQRSGVLSGTSVSLSVPRAGRSGSRDANVGPQHGVASPTFEDTTFDELEDKHSSMMEDILMLEDRLDRFSVLVGRSR